MQKGDCKDTEQQNAGPVVYGLHLLSVRATKVRGKEQRGEMRRIGTVLMIAFLAACQEAPPQGQALANVAGREVTLRELKQSLDQPLGTEDARHAALDALVARTALAMEAEQRGLAQDAELHFALRDARDRLLVDALQQQIRAGLAPISADEINRELSRYPWRYSQRFVVVLKNGEQLGSSLTLDSASLLQKPDLALATAPVGETVQYGGMQWTIVSRTPSDAPQTQWREQAREVLIQRKADAQLAKIIESYRQRGLIRYQAGWGAAGTSPKPK